ncbi:RING/U-box superfamily protein [Trifolium repens]|nr:RING/U-box superfamily protein [Trifolium repens]
MNNQGRNGQVNNTSENNDQNVSEGATEDQDVSMHLSVHAEIPSNHNGHNFQGNTIIAPQARRGAFYLRSLLNHHEQSTFNVGINQLNGLELVPQININQQEYLHSARIVDSPFASLARSSILENQYSSSLIGAAIQVGGNEEQQPYIMSTCDPELMRAMMQIEIETIMERIHIGQHLRLQLQRRHIRTERGLTEDEIIKCISCENFEATVEGTSENKELCCICQEEYLTGEEIGKLDCAHIFHVNCIKLWLARKNICPLCNRRGLFVVGDVIDGC